MQIKNFVKRNADILFLLFLLFYNEVLLRAMCGLSLVSVKSLLLSLIEWGVIGTFCLLFNAKMRRVIETIILLVMTFYAFAQAYHFLFFSTYFSLAKLAIVQELVNVISEVLNNFNAWLLLFLVPIVVWVFALRHMPITEKTSRSPKRFVSFALSVALVIFTITPIAGYAQDETTQEEESYLYESMSNKTRFLNRFGLVTYITRDLTKLVQNELNSTDMSDQIEEYLVHRASVNEMTGIFAGKNLILILAESCGIQALDPDLTPTLYKMSQDGFFFDQFYSPLYPSNTNDTEFIVNTSMVPSLLSGTTSKSFSGNSYPYSLANMMKEMGYQANSYHSFRGSFYNRKAFHQALGFTTYYAAEELGIEPDEDDLEYLNWPEDSELFTKMIENTDFSQPFMNFVISCSGHIPYKYRRSELRENYQTVASLRPDLVEEAAYYYAAQMKLDEGLSILLDYLESIGEAENTVIAIYGDHWPYGLKTEEAIEQFYGDEVYSYERYNTPFIIYNPGTQGETSSTICSTFDVYPTLANLFGIDTTGAWVTGTDLFSEEKTLVPFADASVLTNDYWYDATTGEIFLLTDEMSRDEVTAELSEVNRMMDISQVVLQQNYFRNE